MRVPRWLRRQRAEDPGDGAERLEVRAGLPRRVDGRAERVHVGMHVGARQVGLLIPGRRGQHDVRQQRRRGHPEVDRHQHVELALRDVVGPGNVVGPQSLRSRLCLHVRGGAQQVPQEVLVALARRAEQVGPPDAEHPRPVRGVVRIGDGEFQGTRGELLGDVVGDLAPGGAGLVGDIEAGTVELRKERAPPHRHRGGQHVHGVLSGEPAAAQRAGQRVGPVAVVAPLVGVRVPVGGAGHLARRTRPVGGHRQRRPPGDRTALLLTDVVRPAAAVASHRPGEQQQGQHRPVGGVAVEPLADAGTHDDHGPAAGLLGVAREFPCDADGLRRGHPGDRFLPGRGVRMVGIVIAGGPVTRQPGPGHPVLGQHQVEHRADQVLADPADRNTARQRLTVPVDGVEAWQRNERRLRIAVAVRHRQRRRDVAEFEVPLAHAVVAEAESQRALRYGHRVGGPVEQHRFERRIFDVMSEIGGGEVLSGHQHVAALLEFHQERQVGEAAHVVDEERNAVLHEAFREDDVAHRHRQRAVGAGGARHPLVGELGVVGVVGADADHLGAAVADLGHPVRVGGAGDRDVGAPHHQIRCVPPVPGLRHVGLVAEHLRRGHRQVGVPVVERRHRPAEQFDEPRSRRVADHRHRRDR